MEKSIWKFVGEEFDSGLPRLTAVYIKEEDDSLYFTYPREGDRLGYYFNFTDKTGYDLPAKFSMDFAVYEYPNIMNILAPNRVLFAKQEYYPGMIKREITYSNLGIKGIERIGQKTSGSLTWSLDFDCLTEGFKLQKKLFTILSSEEEFKVDKTDKGVSIEFDDISYHIACSLQNGYGVYRDELSMKSDLKTEKLSFNSPYEGHYLVIEHYIDLLPKESINITFGLSSISMDKAVCALDSKNFEQDIANRWDTWFNSLPYIEFTRDREKKAYYKSWWAIKNNYYDHPKWGHSITESLPVYKGLWQWAMPSVEWHSNQDTDYTSQWVRKAMDMLVDSQREDGYITHAIYIDEEKPGEGWAGGVGIIQTPHLPWVALRYYHTTYDRESLIKWYKAFKDYYDYITRTRDKAFKDIHLWGITTSFDTGLDTTCAFQRVTYGEDGIKEEYCYPAIFAAERYRYELAMAEISREIGKYDREWERRAKRTKYSMDKYLWDGDKKWYGVLHKDGTLDTRVGVDGLFPLVYHIVEPERAMEMEENFTKLIGNYGIRTVAPGEIGFRADVYWRGAAWPKSCSLGMEVCRFYFPHLLGRAFNSILNMVLRYPNIWECFNATTGELARSDYGFLCTPGMSSNVGAGDILGCIWLYHGIPMYDMDMVLPIVPMENFHFRGMRISIRCEDDDIYVYAKAEEEDQSNIKLIDKKGHIYEMDIRSGVRVQIG